MKILLSTLFFGVALMAFGKGGTNNLQYAVDSGNLDMVEHFFATNATLLSPKESAGLLTSAAVHGQTEMAAFLISKRADVNAKGFFGMTPLACMGSAFKSPNDLQYANIATLLIAHGAEVDPVDEYHKTPLLHAVESENPHLADALLKNGACQTNRYGGANFGMTPLYLAIQDRDTEMVRVLLKYNPPLDAKDGDGATPLLLAEELELTNMVEMLHQADPQAALKNYPTPPTKEAMRELAQRIVNGDVTALDQLKKTSDIMYSNIHDYEAEHARVMLNLGRMKVAFDVLGGEAGKGNNAAFQALTNSLKLGRLKSFGPEALGVAAAAGNHEALDILLHYQQWDILESTAMFALYEPAKVNLGPAVDYYASWLSNMRPDEHAGGIMLDVTNALGAAASLGNTNAQLALNKYLADTPTQNQ
jgi:ankyrin repeat protein